jgi:hypothetical protein
MADKKETEKEVNVESEPVENSIEEPKVIEQPTIEEPGLNKEDEQQLSSLDLLWRHAFGELDEWVKRADHRDAILLKAAKQFAEGAERNKGNLVELAAQFYQEFSKWEKTAREEFLMSTTSLQHFFPLKSYEDINKQIDQVQEKTLTILAAPYQRLACA